jgi:hypothetical protein
LADKIVSNKSTTKYLDVTGKLYWPKIYTPDEFRGAVRWTINFIPDNEEELRKIKSAGIQKREKDTPDGKQFAFTRSTSKLMGKKMVYFTPPIIYGEDGKEVVSYTDPDGKLIRSYEDDTLEITRKGDPVMIGNGSKVKITLSVYPTAMGVGNRLESIKLIDLIHYEAPEVTEEQRETPTPEVKQGADVSPPW